MFHGVQRSRTNSISSVKLHNENRQDSIDYDDYQSISDDDNDPMLKILIENIIDNSDSSTEDDEDSHKQNNIHKNWI